MMFLFLLACACSGQADADGAPPFPDGLPSDAVGVIDDGTIAEPIPDEIAPSIVAVDRVAVEDVDAPSPLELLDADAMPAIEEIEGLTDHERALFELLDARIRETSIQTAEEITSRGPLGGGVAGMSAPQLIDLFQTIAYLVIMGLGGALVKILSRQWPAIKRLVEYANNPPAPPASPPAPVDLNQLTTLSAEHAKLTLEREAVNAERARLAEAVDAGNREIQRLKQERTRALASQSSVSDEIEEVRRQGRHWLAE